MPSLRESPSDSLHRQSVRVPNGARIARFPGVDPQAGARERALTRFATELSPTTGSEFLKRLVAYLAECLGFDVVVVAELPPGGVGHLQPVAAYPPNVSSSLVIRALIGTHCERLVDTDFAKLGDASSDVSLDLPIVGSDGRRLGVICGFGPATKVDDATKVMITSIVTHRAAAEMERLRAARELERRDALFVGLAAETQEVVGILDAADVLLVVSPATERVLGYCPETCIGLPVLQLVHPEDRETLATLLRIAGPQRQSVDVRLRHADERWVPMAVCVAEHEDADGRAIRVLSARDLTDRRRLEDRLRQAEKTGMIGRLATGIAHDFGNILMVVRCHADVMRLRTTPDDPRHPYVDAIQDAVTRGASLARQLLEFSRNGETGVTRVDLTASIEQSAALLQCVVGSRIQIETKLSPDARHVVFDASQLEQIILNLTVNARDAMPNGGRITIETSVAGTNMLPPGAAVGDFVCLSISDTGVGIPAHVLPRIFEPLFTTKTDGAGGIGLATVHDIVMRHGGVIEVASTEGHGATFRLSLPSTGTPVARA